MSTLYENFLGMLDLLPAFERDVFILYYLSGMRQTEIAAFFEVSQPTVCYRLQKGLERIKFRSHLPSFWDKDLRKRFSKWLSPTDTEVCLSFIKSTSQSAVAQKFDYSQGFVRHRLFRAIEKLSVEEEDLARILEYVMDNLNAMREVKRFPQEK